LCEMLVGHANCYSTELKHLENNRFEAANIYGKRLVTITDSQNYAGDVSMLKALTGQDTLRYEEKNKQGGQGFRAACMVIIAANEPIASKDYTSGITRRRITLHFTNRVPSSARRELDKEFAPLIPGLINWCLDMPEADMIAYVRDTHTHCPSLTQASQDNLLATNPLAQWLDENIVLYPSKLCPIGLLKRSAGSIDDTNKHLYPNYVDFCESSGIKPLAANRFVTLLDELCSVQLNLDCVKRKRTKEGRFFEGLSIKNINTNGQSPLTQHFSQNG